MADGDPLSGQTATTTDVPDPLAGWQPAASAPAASVPPPAAGKNVTATSFKSLPSDTRKGEEWGGNITPIRSAFDEGYESVPPSVSIPGERSVLTPEAQTWLNKYWPGRYIVNPLTDAAGTFIGDLAGMGNSALTLGNQALRSVGVPEPAIRDLNLELTQAPVAAELRPAAVQGFKPTFADRGYAEMSRPPAPTLSDLLRQQRSAPPTDPVTNAAIDLLRRTAPSTGMPPPPTPFSPGANAPTAPASPGLLGVPLPPQSTPPGLPLVPRTVPMTADEMLVRSQGYYSPADKAAAQGATIKPAAADAIRGAVTSAVETDPQKAIAVGNTPLVQLGKDYMPLQGQPMSYDAAMALDRRLTSEKNMALRSGNNDLARQIGNAQDSIRDKVTSLTSDDTTGDPQALANLAQARQAYAQYVKQSQIEDIQYRASLLPEDRQNAYARSQITTMLRNDNKMRGWAPDERAALEDALQSGNIGSLTNFGLQLIKPFGQAAGGAVGGSIFGAPGAYVGSQAGGTLAETAQSRLRAALSKLTLDRVSQQLSARVPPPAPGQ